MTATMQKSGSGAAMPAGVFGMMGVIYLAMGLVYLWLGIKLMGYGSAIGSLRMSGSVQHLELALDHQRSFWKTMGIMTLIGIVIFFVMMIGMMFVGATMATKFQDEIRAKKESSEPLVFPDSTNGDRKTKSAEEDK